MFERHADALPMSHLGHYKSIVKKMIKKQAATLESFKRSLKQSNQWDEFAKKWTEVDDTGIKRSVESQRTRDHNS